MHLLIVDMFNIRTDMQKQLTLVNPQQHLYCHYFQLHLVHTKALLPRAIVTNYHISKLEI